MAEIGRNTKCDRCGKPWPSHKAGGKCPDGKGEFRNPQNKQAYISAQNGELTISVAHTERPYILITLDLGIPNFTVFSLKLPLVEGATSAMSDLIGEAIGVLLDEVAAFMLSMKYDKDVCVMIYAAASLCFKELTTEADTESSLPDSAQDETIKTYVGSFVLPQVFIDETYDKVVTAGVQIKRTPQYRRIEFVEHEPNKNTLGDAQRVIKMYRNRTIKTQPKPLYVIVYDQTGHPAGSILWKDQLLKKMK